MGANPLQVYIDGKATLDPVKVANSYPKSFEDNQLPQELPKMRKLVSPDLKEKLCGEIAASEGELIITGIKQSFLDHPTSLKSEQGNLTMVIRNGAVVCFDNSNQCVSSSVNSTVISLDDGYVLPGLTAVSVSLGLIEIDGEKGTGDGRVSTQASSLNVENVVYAKYGVHLEGKAFKRARIGGVTKAISAPLTSGGFQGGVSVGIKIKEEKPISLDDGIFQEDVALHFKIGQSSKGTHVRKIEYGLADLGIVATNSLPTISSAISKLRQILSENSGKDNIYAKAANGSLPLVVEADNEVRSLSLGLCRELR